MKKMRGKEETFQWVVLGWNGVLIKVRKHLEKLPGERAFWTGRKNDASSVSSEGKSGIFQHCCQAPHLGLAWRLGLGLVSSSRVSSATLWGRQGSTFSGIVDKGMSWKNFYHQDKKGEQKTGEIELVCVCLFKGKDVLFYSVGDITGREFCQSRSGKINSKE